MALTAERNTPRMGGDRLELPVAATTTLFAGALVVSDAGFAAPGRTAANLVALGRCERTVTALAAGDAMASIRPGIYRFANSAATDAITQAEAGSDCFIVDDQTLAKTDGGGTRSRAGIVIGVDDAGVWVQLGPGL